jgi:hypothetical protein
MIRDRWYLAETDPPMGYGVFDQDDEKEQEEEVKGPDEYNEND